MTIAKEQVEQLAKDYVEASYKEDVQPTPSGTDIHCPTPATPTKESEEICRKIMKIVHAADDPETLAIEIATAITFIMREQYKATPNESFTGPGAAFLGETGLNIPAERLLEPEQPEPVRVLKNTPRTIKGYMERMRRRSFAYDPAQMSVYHALETNSGPMSTEEAIALLNKWVTWDGKYARSMFPELADLEGEVHLYVDASTKQFSTCFRLYGVEDNKIKFSIDAYYDHDNHTWFRYT